MDAGIRTSIVCCSSQGEDWRWVEPLLSDVVDFAFVRCPSSFEFRVFNVSRFIGSLKAVMLARKTGASVLLTHEPTLAFWCASLSFLLRRKVLLFAHAFNFTTLPGPVKRYIFSLAFRRVEQFAVFSEMERDLYSKAFQIDRCRLDFVHWGVNSPSVTNANTPIIAGKYISAIGGNSRDYRTFASAARALPGTKFALVARPENLLNIDIPANVEVHTNIPSGQAMNIMAFSQATVIPLDRTDAPCGHVTIVAGMYLGIPVIASHSAGIEDYILNGKTGILIEPKSASSLVDAILLLEANNSLRQHIVRSSKEFVEQYCSERNIANHFRRWLGS